MAAPGEQSTTVIVVDPRAGAPAADVQEAVAQAVRVCFGLVSVGLGVALRTAGDGSAVPRPRGTPVMDAADVLVGTAWGVARLSGRVAVTGSRVAMPLVTLVGRPPLLPRRFHPAHGVEVMVGRWQRDRPDTVRALGSWTASTMPGAVDAVLAQVDVERLVTMVVDRALRLDILHTIAKLLIQLRRI